MRRARAIMIQGTASHVGKTLLCTALCRLFRQEGWRVAPFKAQNMSNNAWVTRDGGEMARAQALQAEAAGVEPSVHMNPVLLKPKGEAVSEVIVHGRPAGDARARDYYGHWRERAWTAIRASLDRLLGEYDVVVIEGAGSPVEMNLRRRDIVNMRVAVLAGAPVLLVGDVDRGGVFASLLGTLWLLPPAERRRVAGLVVNKFRGDPELFREGVAYLEARARKPVVGVLPWIDVDLEEEDSLALAAGGGLPAGAGVADLDIAAIHYPCVSNFTDLDPLRRVPGVRVRWVRGLRALGTPDAVILPGSKNTIRDLLFLRETGLDRAITELARRGTPVVGLCGGYQMMGRLLSDPHGYEAGAGDAGGGPGAGGEVQGLGLLPAVTVFGPRKRTAQSRGRVVAGEGPFACLQGQEVRGYEIHVGRTVLDPGAQPLFLLQEGEGRAGAGVWDGCLAAGGAVFGTYLHGLFDNAGFLQAWLAWLRGRRPAGGGVAPAVGCRARREEEFDRLAEWARRHLDLKLVYEAMGR